MKDNLCVKAPLRIDVGGTWDLKAFALPFEHLKPTTVNIALDLPVTLNLSWRDDNLIVISDGDSCIETNLEQVDFRSSFGLLLAICSRYQCDGFTLDIDCTVPPRNGLGGSGAIAAAFIYAITECRGHRQSLPDVAMSVHDIEEGLRYSHCGLQDQCASIYGGVHQWAWHYGRATPFTRTTLMGVGDYAQISNRLLVAYLGRGHGSDINQQQVDSLYDPRTRSKWFEINDNTERAARHIEKSEWGALADCINTENQIRLSVVPERLAVEAEPLYRSALSLSAGFGIAGAGAGGCVFAFLEDPAKLDDLADIWAGILQSIDDSKIFLRPGISCNGVEVK